MRTALTPFLKQSLAGPPLALSFLLALALMAGTVALTHWTADQATVVVHPGGN